MTGFLIVVLCSALALPTVGASDFAVNPRDSTLKDGHQLTLSCIMPSVWSNDSIQWKKDGVLFDPPSLGFTVTPGNLSVTFDSDEHVGSYTCHPGLHGYENFASCPASVKKAIINDDFEVVSKSIQGFVGGVAILPCAPPTSTPKPTYRWVRRGSRNKVPSTSEVLPSGDLYFHSLTAGDSGDYRCVVVNNVLQEKKRGPYLTFNVSSVTRSTGTIEFYSRPADLVVKSGEVVILPCAARGFPLPQYSWSYRLNETSDWLDLSHPPNVGYYNLSNVRLADRGIYRCTATSSNGTQSSVQAVVTVKAVPQSVAIVQTVKSDAIQLACDAIPASDYNIMWSIPKTATVVSGTTGDRVIAISRTASSAGIYQCRVYHEFGCLSQEKVIEIEPHALSSHDYSDQQITPSSSLVYSLVAASSPFIIDVHPGGSLVPSPLAPLEGAYSTVSRLSISPALGLLPPQLATSDYAYEATAALSPAPSPMATPEVLTIAFDPVGPIVLDEGQNFTLVCVSSREGNLQLLKDSTKLAERVGKVLQYPLVVVNKEHVGQYTCQLEEMGSVVVTTTINMEVRAVRPNSPPTQPTAVWLSDKMIRVSWQPLVLKPGQSAEGVKLNWGERDPPKNYARLSVPVYNTSVVIDVNRTGTVYVSVWLYNRAGDGPTAVLNVTIPEPHTPPPIITPTATIATPPTTTTAAPPTSSPLPSVLTIAFDPVGPIVLDEGQNFTLVCVSSREGNLQLLKDSTKLAERVGKVLQYPLVVVNKEHVGQYTCQLEEMGSIVVTTTINLDVQAVRPNSPPTQPTAVWLSDKMIRVSWQPLVLKPGQSAEGVKLNWGERDPPKNYARLSVPVYNTSVVIDVNRTGTVYVSVWLYNRAGDGPTAVLNVTIPGPTAAPTTSSPLPIVYFDPKSYVAAVGEQVVVTCRSGSLGTLKLIKDGSDTLSNAHSAMMVHYTLRSVRLTDTGLYHCIRESEGRTASFRLTVVDYKANCSVLSSNLIEVKVEPSAEIANVDISVDYIKIDRDVIPTLHYKTLPSTGVAVLDNLLPDTPYKIVVNKATEEGAKFKIGSCDNIRTLKPFEITREMVAVTNIGTDSIQVSLIKIQTELETRGIFNSNVSIKVQVQVGGEWQTTEFTRTLTVPLVNGAGVLNVRIQIGNGQWAESDITFTSPMSTTPSKVELGVVYAVIIVGGVLFAGLVAVLVLIMKYVQINRREKDKVTDHRVERLSRQSSVRSTVSWSVKQHSISPDFKVDTSPKNPSSTH